VPIFVTVEDTPRNGTTAERVYGCIDSPVPQRDKRIFGLCSQDDLRNAILEQPNRTAILIGMDTDVCVLHSAVSLLSEGFRTVIESDATEDPGLARDHGLACAQFLGAELVSTRGLYYEWVRSVDGLKAEKGRERRTDRASRGHPSLDGSTLRRTTAAHRPIKILT
jgi:hypothetical protein